MVALAVPARQHTGGSGPRQHRQRVSAPLPQKRKARGESLPARCSCCRKSGACLPRHGVASSRLRRRCFRGPAGRGVSAAGAGPASIASTQEQGGPPLATKATGFNKPFPKREEHTESLRRAVAFVAGPGLRCPPCAGASSGCRCVRGLAASRALALRRCRCGSSALSSVALAAMAAGGRAGAGDRLSRVRRVLRWWRRGLLFLGLPPVVLPVSLDATNGAARVVAVAAFPARSASTQVGHRPRQRKQRSSATLSKKKKHRRSLRKHVASVAANPGPGWSPCVGAAAALGGPPVAA